MADGRPQSAGSDQPAAGSVQLTLKSRQPSAGRDQLAAGSVQLQFAVL